MFGFLKDKLKQWVEKAKDKLKPEEKVVEEKPVEEKIEKKEEKKIKKEPVEKPKEEIKKKKTKEKKQEKVEKLIKEAKEKEIKEPPLEFKPGLQKYEPDLQKIKEEKEEPIIVPEEKEVLKKEPVQLPDIIETKESDKKIEKELLEEIEEIKIEEKVPEKKQGFFKRILGISKKEKEEIKKVQEDILHEEEEIKKELEEAKTFGKKEPEVLKKEKEPAIVQEEKQEEIIPDLEIKEVSVQEEKEELEEKKQEKKSFLQKLKSTFIYRITEEDFNNLFDDLEMLLLENNVALGVVEDIKKNLSKRLIDREIKKDELDEIIKKELKSSLYDILIDPDDPIDAVKLKKDKPFVILFFGINGSGKTTSIAKLAYHLKEKGYSVVLAAADTFRAASIEQIQIHADKLKVHLIKQDYGADPAAVGFDAIKYAKNHHIDVVLIDTAGRMHTKTNLISEMEKIVRVTNPDLKIFVAESIAGNDATEQAKTFHKSVNIDGTILSKADVDEKGGTIISVSHATKKPIFYLGTGQEYKDLKLFNKEEYIESLGL
ncbi:MAG: signal recognition particle-docking protein FtsY [Nanoarchaeota archaeon]|nr:signal recognition particle-docking protein FtsY [Nanoarchaeota archaeon]